MRLELRLWLAMRVEQRRAAALRRLGASQRMRAREEMGEQRMRATEERTEEMRKLGRQRVVRRRKERALKERLLLMRLLERRGQSEEMTVRVRVRSRRLPRQRWRSSVLTQDARAKTWRGAMRKRHRARCRV